jgi:tight adherence protein C
MPNIETLIEIGRNYLTVRLGAMSFGPIETLIVGLTLAVALLSAFNLWRIGRREGRRDRLAALRAVVVDRAAQAQRPRWYDQLGTLLAPTPIVGTAEQQRLLGVLAGAGIKGHGNLAIIITTKICGAVALAVLSWLYLKWMHLFAELWQLRLAVLVGGLMLGFRLPEIILSRLAARRRLRLEQGLPDALDLLVICAEAGLSLDQAIEQVGRDLRPLNPAVADEFATTAAEMRVLPNRGDALVNLVQRTRLASLRGVTATLNQTIRFGTPLAESMRVLAAQMRTERLARLEERAARLPVLLAFPLMAFILPALLIVVGTPIALRIVDFLGKFTNGFGGHGP